MSDPFADLLSGVSLAPAALEVDPSAQPEPKPPKEPGPIRRFDPTKRSVFRERGSVRRRAQVAMVAVAQACFPNARAVEKPQTLDPHLDFGDHLKLFPRVHVTRYKFQVQEKLKEATAFAHAFLGNGSLPVIFHNRPNEAIVAVMFASDFLRLAQMAEKWVESQGDGAHDQE